MSYEYQEALKQLPILAKDGYSIEAGANGFNVKRGSRFVYGASVMLPRSRPLHWRHARQNRKDFLVSAVREAIKDKQKIDITL